MSLYICVRRYIELQISNGFILIDSHNDFFLCPFRKPHDYQLLENEFVCQG